MNVNHFEHIWEKAEIISVKNDLKTDNERILLIIEYLNLLSTDHEKYMGKILFQLCGLSKSFNVNTYKALFSEMQDVQISDIPEE